MGTYNNFASWSDSSFLMKILNAPETFHISRNHVPTNFFTKIMYQK